MRTLTHEQTQGTKTYHLPFKVTGMDSPEVTVLVRRNGNGTFRAGMSVCSRGDVFSRRSGRRRAFNRMIGCPIIVESPDELLAFLAGRFAVINEHHEGTVSHGVWRDLAQIIPGLNKAFDALDERREKHPK